MISLLLTCRVGVDPQAAMAEHLAITSPAFSEGGDIPRRCTCEGDDISPPLSWTGVPANTKTLALVVHDPDVPDPAHPKRTWVHWVLYNIPGTARGLPEGSAGLPDGALSGKNDWKRSDYGGPCPPIGRHRYIHTLYALDTALPNLSEPTRLELEKAMAGHILAKAELIGTYKKHST